MKANSPSPCCHQWPHSLLFRGKTLKIVLVLFMYPLLGETVSQTTSWNSGPELWKFKVYLKPGPVMQLRNKDYATERIIRKRPPFIPHNSPQEARGKVRLARLHLGNHLPRASCPLEGSWAFPQWEERSWCPGLSLSIVLEALELLAAKEE